ncbi:glycosyltransferase family 4 protein [Chitinophaga sp. LS1]|uniref:glycosyltransferase family 4 protein n=1 Tax=Chitinophaga sp. LS1 TaxID=3051176 RepID=UPI002AAB7A39|nr:glycosyltransferase family 4 protein [Chitinophaga sp. LS1]WPV68986.1 glycosyltransferase family 4 protein [Chitinophaga sp. LS1]
MKFVFINTGTISQNAGIVRCLGLGTALVQLGHDVSIMINDDAQNVQAYGEVLNGIRFIYTKSGSGREQISKTLHLAKLSEVDYVHCMGAGSSIFLPALIAKKLLGKKFKLVVDFEDRQSLLVPPVLEKRILYYEKLAVKYADKVICASNELALLYKELYGIRAGYLPFAIDARRQIGRNVATADRFTIGYLGNLIQPYREQVDFLLATLPDMNDLQLIIAGKGEMLPVFQQEVKRMGLEDKVQFAGFVPDEKLNQLFGELDACVFYLPDIPVNRYRCPNKAFMYASTGLPVVASKVGEVVRVLQDYPNAAFFDNDNPADFINAVAKAKTQHAEVPDAFYEKNSWVARAKVYVDFITGKQA